MEFKNANPPRSALVFCQELLEIWPLSKTPFHDISQEYQKRAQRLISCWTSTKYFQELEVLLALY